MISIADQELRVYSSLRLRHPRCPNTRCPSPRCRALNPDRPLPSAAHCRPAAWLAVLAVLALWVAAAAVRAADVPLTSIATIRRLTRNEADRALPVRLEGVCVWSGPGGNFVISGGDESIWVDPASATEQGLLGKECDANLITPGTSMEIEGVTNKGGYGPVIYPTVIRRTGMLPLPEPKRVSADQLATGGDDSQWVEFDGVVQEVFTDTTDGGIVGMKIGGRYAWLYLATGSTLDAGRLVDARVRVRGVYAPDHNIRSEAIGLKFQVTDTNAIQVLTQPPADPFAAPRVSLQRLLPFSPDAKPYNRKVTAGLVTFAVPGEFFYLQDGRTSVRVSSQSRELQVGDQVEVAGFVDTSCLFASMNNVLVRVLGTAPMPEPWRITPGTILGLEMYPAVPSNPYGDINGQTITLRGKLARVDWAENLSPDRMRIESENWAFSASLPNRHPLDPQLTAAWAPGSEVEVTGICELEFDDKVESREFYHHPIGFHLLLTSPQAVRIVSHPPWWTPFRLFLTLAGAVVTVVVLLLWSAILHRQVAKQTRIIGKKIHTEATQAERTRIARDLHDSIEQQLAGISLHIYGAQSAISTDPLAASGALDLARRLLKHTQRETRTSIRDLRADFLTRQGLAAALRAMVEQVRTTNGPHVEVQSSGDFHDLPPDSEYQLYRLAQEALANALKHANAQHITISLHDRPAGVCLSVVDDGCGFQPSAMDLADLSHFGMLGMQERSAKLRAELAIVSAPGKGCSVTVTLPPASPPE